MKKFAMLQIIEAEDEKEALTKLKTINFISEIPAYYDTKTTSIKVIHNYLDERVQELQDELQELQDELNDDMQDEIIEKYVPIYNEDLWDLFYIHHEELINSYINYNGNRKTITIDYENNFEQAISYLIFIYLKGQIRRCGR